MPMLADPATHATSPADVNALFQWALQLHHQGKLAQALQIYEDVLSISPEHFDALFLAAWAALHHQKPALALMWFDKALSIQPDHALSHFKRGVALHQLKRVQDALVSYDRAIALNPDHAPVWLQRGNALKDLNRLDQALSSFERALALRPDFADACFQIGFVLVELKRLQEAVTFYDRSLAIQPNHAEAHYNKGNALRDLNRLEEARVSFERAIEIQPDLIAAHSNLGGVLRRLNRGREALASYQRALELQPDAAQIHINRGNAWLGLLHIQDAIASYDRAIAIQPNHAKAHWYKSVALLLSGQFEQGWLLYEWRWRKDMDLWPMRTFSQPLWLGEQDIAGQTILLHAEQGLGDVIQFCRYVRLVKAKGARIVFEVQPALLNALKQLEEVDEWVAAGDPLPAFDVHCPLMSLPLAFKTVLTEIPSPTPYLRAPADACQRWANQLGVRKRPCVGLVWSGSTTHQNDALRSLPLAKLLAHLPPGCDYVSLQKEVRERDQQALAGSGIRHFGEGIQDFNDTAALCELMDLVISVDTSVAHWAAAMGKPTWIMLPYAPDWRWLLDRDDSPWYASVKLFRQGESRTWDEVLKRVADALVAELRPLAQ